MLVQLLNVPQNEGDWNSWSQNHRLIHDQVRQAIQAKGGPNLASFVLDPIPLWAFREWLERNQQSHTDANGALGLQSTDLLELDPRDQQQVADWVYYHWIEHQNMNLALGI